MEKWDEYCERLLRLPDVRRITGLPTTSIYEKMRVGAFPRSVPLGQGRTRAWLLSEVQAWIEQRRSERDQEVA